MGFYLSKIFAASTEDEYSDALERQSTPYPDAKNTNQVPNQNEMEQIYDDALDDNSNQSSH